MEHATSPIGRVAIVGAGVIGNGWAARCPGAAGLDVTVYRPRSAAGEQRLQAALDTAWPSLERVGLAPGADRARARFTTDLEAAVADAGLVQENAPEREDVKRDVLARIDAATAPDTLIGSSTSGLLPSTLQADCAHPERVFVAHPFNPVYLLPLVELVGGRHTSAEAIERARAFYAGIGMRPLHVRREIEGHVADRLMEALWREALHLVNDGVATTEEIDAAIVYGAGLRWSLMGTFLTFHLAGGESGMRHMLEQFGPALKLPWTKLEAPELSEELIDPRGGRHRPPGRRAQRARPRGAPRRVPAAPARGRARVLARGRGPRGAHLSMAAPLELLTVEVPATGLDYNGHMNDAAYAIPFSDSIERLMGHLGLDAAAREREAYTIYTLESHIRYLREAHAGERLAVDAQLLDADAKRLHVFLRLVDDAGEVRATAEQMLIGIDSAAGRAAPFPEAVAAAVERLAAEHAELPAPDGAGRPIGIRRR
ncbi:MAG: 3-hydroxyacyl-CoA dehydrogenase NAD-binding domain-containing protein [Halofilum sp. (in: g-proteobacteria)]|nr:3-hydroxyacyl-CoA dehydrogenase NAD-binding domain-containing protein [Halofilum sp. (in: g-proteobacteria)]